MTPGNHQPPDDLSRVQESLAFTERTVEQLSGEIAELNRRLAEMQARVLRLERRLDRVESPPEDGGSGVI